jgi:N-acetylneuraminic acid mutarotase
MFFQANIHQRIFSALQILAIALILSVATPAHATPAGSWQELPPTPSVRTESSVALLDGKIYMIGGFTPKGITDKVEAWDPESNTWLIKSSLPRPLHHSSVTVVENKLYVIGGFFSGRWTPVKTVYEYDPAKNKWTTKAPMPTARGALAAGAVDGKIYVIGGAHRKLFRLVNTDANEVFDPKRNVWEKLTPVPTPRDHHTIAVHNGLLHVIGGRVNVSYAKNLSAHEAYDPTSATWTTLPPLPTKRSGITSQVLNGKIHVFGGEATEGTFNENEAYDPATQKWTTMAPMLSSLHGLGSAVYKGRIHLLTGGPHPGGGGSNTHTVFSAQ